MLMMWILSRLLVDTRAGMLRICAPSVSLAIVEYVNGYPRIVYHDLIVDVDFQSAESIPKSIVRFRELIRKLATLCEFSSVRKHIVGQMHHKKAKLACGLVAHSSVNPGLARAYAMNHRYGSGDKRVPAKHIGVGD